MQTLTIRADETLISQIVAISKALADTTNQKLIIDEDYPIYDDGKTMEQRIAEYKADIEVIRHIPTRTNQCNPSADSTS